MIVGQDKPSLKDLSHHGVLGMKWGKTRAKATGDQIVQARRRLENKQNDIFTAHENARATTKKKTPERAKADARVDRMVVNFNKSKDRVIASRMTRGEKAVAFVFAGPFGAIPIITTSLSSRRIEQKQLKGGYDKKKKK